MQPRLKASKRLASRRRVSCAASHATRCTKRLSRSAANPPPRPRNCSRCTAAAMRALTARMSTALLPYASTHAASPSANSRRSIRRTHCSISACAAVPPAHATCQVRNPRDRPRRLSAARMSRAPRATSVDSAAASTQRRHARRAELRARAISAFCRSSREVCPAWAPRPQAACQRHQPRRSAHALRHRRTHCTHAVVAMRCVCCAAPSAKRERCRDAATRAAAAAPPQASMPRAARDSRMRRSAACASSSSQ